MPCYLIVRSGFLKIFDTHYGICFLIEYLVSTKFRENIRGVGTAFPELRGAVGGSQPTGMLLLPTEHFPLTLRPPTPSSGASPKDAIGSTAEFENLCLKKGKGT